MGTHLYSTEICYQVVRHVTKSHASSVLSLAEEPSIQVPLVYTTSLTAVHLCNQVLFTELTTAVCVAE